MEPHQRGQRIQVSSDRILVRGVGSGLREDLEGCNGARNRADLIPALGEEIAGDSRVLIIRAVLVGKVVSGPFEQFGGLGETPGKPFDMGELEGQLVDNSRVGAPWLQMV